MSVVNCTVIRLINDPIRILSPADTLINATTLCALNLLESDATVVDHSSPYDS